MKQQRFDKFQQLLCPAGSGVYTVSSGKSKKANLEQQLYGATGEAAIAAWRGQLKSLEQNQLPVLLGVCSDVGGGIQRGANWGPLAIREKLMQHEQNNNYFDLGDIRVIPHILHDKYLNAETISQCRQALFDDPDSPLPVSPLSILEDVATELYKNYPEMRLFSLGGDHSVSYSLVKSFLTAKAQRKNDLAVVHFDAHTDLLVRRLGMDLCFGSWATHILEFLEKPDYLVQLGIRASAKNKSYWESIVGVKQFWANEIKENTLLAIADKLVIHLQKRGVNEIYISFDIDAIDQRFASATGTPEPNGMQPEHACILIERLASEFKVSGADLVEVAPHVVHAQSDLPQPETTLATAGRIANALLATLK